MIFGPAGRIQIPKDGSTDPDANKKPGHLFHLGRDIGETTDLRADHGERSPVVLPVSSGTHLPEIEDGFPRCLLKGALSGPVSSLSRPAGGRVSILPG